MGTPVRTFEDSLAVRTRTPLWVGLAGPGSSGKTYSALRLAVGMREVFGGTIVAADSEGMRMLHYAPLEKDKDLDPLPAGQFRYNHIPFGPPFSSRDYQNLVAHCAARGASVCIIDSMSHEHEGQGGFLEFHDAEVLRLQNNPAAEYAAWKKPKKYRTDLRNAMIQLPIAFILCFRAKKKSSLVKDKKGKSVVVDQDWMPVGGYDPIMYDLTVACLLPPGAEGVPDWDHAKYTPDQKLWIKRPFQFQELLKPGRQLDERIGRELALWSTGGRILTAAQEQQHSEIVTAAAAPIAQDPQPHTGPDQSEPCPTCRNNVPHCETCKIEMMFRKSGIDSRKGRLFDAYWQCPRVPKCKRKSDKRYYTSIPAASWHALLEGEQKLKDERAEKRGPGTG